MPTLKLAHWAVRATDPDTSHLTDLTLVTTDTGADVLYATNRYDGALTAWSTGGTALSLIDSAAYTRGASAGGQADIAVVTLDSGAIVVTGGGKGDALVSHEAMAQGLGTARSLGTVTALKGDLIATETVSLPTGIHMIYGGIAGEAGIARVSLTDTGALRNALVTPDYATTTSDGVTALASATVSGNTYLFSTATNDPGITSWTVAGNGALYAADQLWPKDGLWISDPTAMETVTVAGSTYLILGAAGSGSLSVMAVGADGGLGMRDHLLDDLNSRFAGVTALETVEHDGAAYVIAGGSDDGISVYRVLPGGELMALAHIADGVDMGLGNVSAITARGAGNGLDIFVASASEDGITRLRLDTSPAGKTLTATAAGGNLGATGGADLMIGGAGNDRLFGGAGDDILRDGAGEDVLTGGAGADVFIMALDGVADTIADFDLGKDKVDLSGWGMLRSVDQLTFTGLSNGVRIVYGDETLTIRSSDGSAIDPARLTGADLLGTSRIPMVITPGLAGPGKPDPELPERPAPPDLVQPGPDEDPNPDPGQQTPGETTPDKTDPGTAQGQGGGRSGEMTGGAANDRITGGTGAEVMKGAGGNDVLKGMGGNDRLEGGAGNDRLDGGAGDDVLFGGKGNDSLFGGKGDDKLVGKAGDDLLKGSAGTDVLKGGGGADRMMGGGGDDTLKGGGGGDTMKGNGGADRMKGGAGADVMKGGGGADRMLGGGGNDTLKGGGAADRIDGGGGKDVLNGGGGGDAMTGGKGNDRLAGKGGADTLDGGTGNDVLTGQGGADTFVFNAGRDRVTDFSAKQGDLIHLDDGLWKSNLSEAKVVARYAEIDDGNLVFDFGKGNVLEIEGVDSLTRVNALFDIV